MDQITKDTAVEDLLNDYPTLTKVFIDLGLPCLVCGNPFWGSIDELARQHNVEVENLVKKLNQAMRELNEKL